MASKDWVQELKAVSRRTDEGFIDFGSLLLRLTFIPIVAVALGMADAAFSLFGIITSVARGLGGGLQSFIGTFLRSMGEFIGGSVGTALIQFESGAWSSLGPLQVLIAVATVMGSFWIVAWTRNQEVTSNLFPGVGFDVLGFGDEGEDEGS
jgi:hypothetical protein